LFYFRKIIQIIPVKVTTDLEGSRSALAEGQERLASVTAELEAGQQRLKELRLSREKAEAKLKELQQKLDNQEKQQVRVT
jgi:chromosome segregation ATPase